MRAYVVVLLLAVLCLATACGTAKGRYDGDPIDDDDNGGGGIGGDDDDNGGGDDDDSGGPEVENFTWVDADGNQVELYDYLGQIVLLDVSAFWCQPCREETPLLQAMWERFSDRDFQLIQLITEDADYTPATQQTAADWRDEFGLTYLVCADPDWTLKPYFTENVLPFMMLLDRDFHIQLATHQFDGDILARLIERLF